MPRRPKFPLTSHDVATIEAETRRAFPNHDAEFRRYAVASEVIINILGPEWWSSRLTGEKADPYFVKEDDASRYLHQHRVSALGYDLLRCQHFPGFAEQCDEMRQRSLSGVWHELHVARMLADNGHAVAFVARTAVRGEDY